jgi:hypothetical protein
MSTVKVKKGAFSVTFLHIIFFVHFFKLFQWI